MSVYDNLGKLCYKRDGGALCYSMFDGSLVYYDIMYVHIVITFNKTQYVCTKYNTRHNITFNVDAWGPLQKDKSGTGIATYAFDGLIDLSKTQTFTITVGCTSPCEDPTEDPGVTCTVTATRRSKTVKKEGVPVPRNSSHGIYIDIVNSLPQIREG